MTIDGWLGVYLFGAAIAFALINVKVAITYLIWWVTKANVWKKNLSKIQRPEDKEPWYTPVLTYVITVLVESSLSWINVPVALWQIGGITLKAMRDLGTPVPERLKELRYPLRTVPNLDAEIVWAHVLSIAVFAGEPTPTSNAIVEQLIELRGWHPSFRPNLALKRLEWLGICDHESIAEAMEQLSKRKLSAYFDTHNDWNDSEDII